ARRFRCSPLLRRSATLRRLACGLAGTHAFFRRNLDPGTPGFRQPDRDRLFSRTRPVLALAHVLDFLAYELASLGAGGFAFALVLLRARNRLLVRHVAPPCQLVVQMLTPGIQPSARACVT